MLRETTYLYLQHLHEHINDISDRIIWPEAERIQYICPNPGENTENDIFELKLHKHGKSMVSAQHAVLSSRKFPEYFQMVMPFLSLTRMMTSSPSRVRAARERGFYL